MSFYLKTTLNFELAFCLKVQVVPPTKLMNLAGSRREGKWAVRVVSKAQAVLLWTTMKTINGESRSSVTMTMVIMICPEQNHVAM
jgi:hypothetical protein